jgi:hypothetical protein
MKEDVAEMRELHETLKEWGMPDVEAKREAIRLAYPHSQQGKDFIFDQDVLARKRAVEHAGEYR